MKSDPFSLPTHVCYRIKRYHIQQTAMRRQVEIEDDLYDF
jgi:hypothetical protein